MRTDNYLIAEGNKTMLVQDCPSTEQLLFAKESLSEVEQVGFVSNETTPFLTMMGGELCIDAMIALAWSLKIPKGNFKASGVADLIQFTNTHESTRIRVTLPYIKTGNMILFEGIGYLCTDTSTVFSKQEIATLADTHLLPAFGIINYVGTSIRPTIYVNKTDSLVQESACGSGSIALHLVTGAQDILQPSGGKITITHEGDTFTVETTVTRVV